MKTTTIQIEPSVKYLSEVMTSLPTNCLFDKGKVGSGGTTIAIESPDAYVICVPFVSLIENKLAQYPNNRYKGEILGVYQGITEKDIIDYVERTEVPKIIVTYDSLFRLTDVINPKDYKLLIDELHLLFTQYSFRSEAAQSVLNSFKKYKEYCFMTATPLEDEFILDELKDIPVVEAIWTDTRLINIESVYCANGVKAAATSLILGFLSGLNKGNAYIFVNSIKFMNELINSCKLDTSNTRVIYSKNNKDAKSLIPNGKTIDAPKKINILTSCVFEGSDIYDEEGVTIMISDGSKAHTLLDISTSFQQISGRIRNSKYWSTVTHLYTETRYTNVSYEEFKKQSKQEADDSIKSVEEYNKLSEIALSKLLPLVDVNASYFQIINNKFKFDINKVKMDLFQFKIARNMYSARVNITSEYAKYDFDCTEYTDKSLTIIDLTPIEKKSFKEIVQMVKEEMQNPLVLETPVQEMAYLKYRFLKKAIEKLGFERIETLKYVQKDIKNALTFESSASLGNKVLKIFANNGIGVGDFVSLKKSKEIFTKIYSQMNIKSTPKGSLIKDYYDVKDIVTKINGKSTSGYTIIRPKMIFKNN